MEECDLNYTAEKERERDDAYVSTHTQLSAFSFGILTADVSDVTHLPSASSKDRISLSSENIPSDLSLHIFLYIYIYTVKLFTILHKIHLEPNVDNVIEQDIILFYVVYSIRLMF